MTTTTTNNDHRSRTSPMEMHGKALPKVSTITFLMTTAMIPVWAVTVLPMSILYQVGVAILRTIRPSSSSSPSSSAVVAAGNSHHSPLDSGYVVDPTTVLPRSKRPYDVIVLGATGFTGYLAARYLMQTYGIQPNKKHPSVPGVESSKGGAVHWAIAGRSQHKLDQVKHRLKQEFLHLKIDILQLETIIVDTSIPSTLPNLVNQTRVVVTTAGPYALYGSSVVEFCAKFGTHYVDITGEVDWVKAMMCLWQSTAHTAGAKLISFCGNGTSLFPFFFVIYVYSYAFSWKNTQDESN
jgi:Saccharopine dehydrogenase NADP binding domain